MIEKNIRLQPHHSRDLLVGRRSDGRRPKYQPPSQGGGFANVGGGGGGGGHHRDAPVTQSFPVYQAPAPVTTAKAPPSILSKPTVTTTPITRDVMPIVPTATKRPTKMLDIAGDIKAQQKLQEDIRESQRTGAYAKELGLPAIRRDVIPTPIINPWEETEKAGNLVDLTNLGDDAKTRQVQIIQKKADLSWQNKSTYEKEEQQEKWDAAESKIKLQKEGGFWKSLGNIAMAMVLPALLPAKLVKGYNLYKTVKSATAFANKIGLTDQDVMQIVKQKYFGGKDISSQIAGKENVIAKNIAQFTGQGDDLSDIEGQMAFAPGSKKDKKLKALHGERQGVLELQNQGLDITFDPKKEKEYQELLKEDKEQTTEPKTILVGAKGGRIDKPLAGRSRDI